MGVLVLTQPMPPAPIVAALRRALPDEPVFDDVNRAAERAPEIEALVTWRLTPGLAELFPSLRFIAASAAGVDKIVGPALPPRLPVTRTVDPAQNQQIAQYVAAVVLRHVRDLARYEAQQRDRVWRRHAVPAPSDCTVGLLGLGESGRVVARALGALGFMVAGWSRSPRQLDGVETFHGTDGLAWMLPRCQVLICLLPLTAETMGIVDAQLLQRLPAGAFVVNVARGGHVVEADLVGALRSGHLAGAALDVQAAEPLPPDSALWQAPRLQLTPHIASLPSPDAIATQVVENLVRTRRGEPLLRTVDPALGY